MDAWAQLVSTTNICSEPVKITKQKFVIGRAQDADLCLPENRHVSGYHCIIEKDSLGNVWLQDISTNGTFLNSGCKISGKRVPLKHGDEIFVVYQGFDSDINVAFLFQDFEELRCEELGIMDDANGQPDETQPYKEDENSFINPEYEKNEDICANERYSDLADSDCDEEPAAKLVKSRESQNICREDCVTSSTNGRCKTWVKNEQGLDLTFTSYTTGHNMPCHLTGRTSKQSFDQEQVTSLGKLPKDKDVTQDNAKMLLETSAMKAIPSEVPALSNKTTGVPELLEEQLICAICQEILYNSVSLQPCMHIFCAGCYSDWMDRSTECPTCRKSVTRIKKYHPMKNVIEAYLTACPEKQRPEEDRKKLDAADKITKDNMTPRMPTHPVGEYNEEEEDVDEEDVDEEDEGLSRTSPAAINVLQNPRPMRTICRQCPDYHGSRPARGSVIVSPVLAVTSLESSNGASYSRASEAPCIATGPSAKTYPEPSVFTCSVNQNHILCLCCLQPMPHRPIEVNETHPEVLPPQQCAVCNRAFCHLYWGCFGQCDGCLAQFADMKFRSEVLNNLILQNLHESKGLRLYLESKNLTIEDLHRSCVQKLRDGIYSCSDEDILLGSDLPICYNCALRNFSQLAFEFRRDIPELEMPVDYRGRPNCRWGRHCRTQIHNQKHTETYNQSVRNQGHTFDATLNISNCSLSSLINCSNK